MGLDTVELVLEVEKQFDVLIPDERAATTETVGQLAALVCELREQSGAPLPCDEVRARLRKMISDQFAIPLDRVTAEANFVKDFKLD